MAYVAAINREIAIRHKVLDLAGVSLVSGEAANITSALVDPDGDSSAITVTITEVGSTGYYSAAFTPDTAGVWLLELTNPAGTDEAVSEYAVQCVTISAVGDVAGNWLTSLVNLEERLAISGTNPSDSPDAYLNNLIARSSSRIESLLGREIPQDTFTEYISGDGSPYLNLRRGPVSSVTSVKSVSYDTDGNETLTDVTDGSYRVWGTEANWKLPGYLEMASSAWTWGQRNYQVVYVAGYATIPADIEEACLAYCVYMKNRRKDVATSSRDIGDGAIGFHQEQGFGPELRSMLDSYMDVRCA